MAPLAREEAATLFIARARARPDKTLLTTLMSARSAVAWTICRLRSSSPRRGSGPCPPSRYWRGWTAVLRCLPVACTTRPRGNARSRPRSSGATNCEPQRVRVVSSARRLRRRLHARGRREVAEADADALHLTGREEPVAPLRRTADDARDDPRVRRRAPRGGQGRSCSPAAATPNTSPPWGAVSAGAQGTPIRCSARAPGSRQRERAGSIRLGHRCRVDWISARRSSRPRFHSGSIAEWPPKDFAAQRRFSIGS